MQKLCRFNISLLLLVGLICVLPLGGCGGTQKVEVQNKSLIQTTGTLGSQLIDLHTTYQAGTLTEKEYKSLKNSLLKKYK
ncbi:MAG: hypothetical protein OCC45_10360 [Desulfotalea sp.]